MLYMWSAGAVRMRAYVLIDAAAGRAKKITAELRKKSGVMMADVINGPHPVIACIEGINPSSIARTVLFDIRNIKGVNDLTVYLSIEKGQKEYSDSISDDLSSGIFPVALSEIEGVIPDSNKAGKNGNKKNKKKEVAAAENQ
jgi:hypothetical protein